MTTSPYQTSSTLNPHPSNIPATYTATDHHQHAQTINYGSSSAAPVTSSSSESRFNKSFFISIPGILKLVSLVLCFIAFICVETAWQCYGTHAFLATVAILVILIQVALIVIYAFRLNERLTTIDVEFLDLFVTAHDAVYLLVASCVTIHYCRAPASIAGAVMGILAFSVLTGNTVISFFARRSAMAAESNGQGAR